MMKRQSMFLTLFVLLIFSVDGATIYGSVYDLSLRKVNNAVVEINSTPLQRMVSVDGRYEFAVNEGDYEIAADYENGQRMTTHENISIRTEGEFIYDLFLFPDLVDELSLAEDTDFSFNEPFGKKSNIWFLILGVALLMLISLLYLIYRLKILADNETSAEEMMLDDELSGIIVLLKKNHGRMTQKNIRKQFPLSEAKISLMLAELESLGKVKKIKKGRGNIVVLVKQ